MSIERVKGFFAEHGMEKRVWEFDESSATVELAAKALSVSPAHIAKTLSFRMGEGCILVVTAGDARMDNHKYKERFGTKARMLAFEEVEPLTGSAPGGVCPFAQKADVPIYPDVSLKRFTSVFPACGSDNSAIEMKPDELFRYSRAEDWVDVCKDWGDETDVRLKDEPDANLPPLDDGEVRIRVRSVSGYHEQTGYVPAYVFAIERVSDGACIGACDLRLGYVRNTYYGGNIGYRIDEAYRGRHGAQRAVRLLFDVARRHEMPYVTISCRESNAASAKTLAALGGALIETRVPPSYTGLYTDEGVRENMLLYRFDL